MFSVRRAGEQKAVKVLRVVWTWVASSFVGTRMRAEVVCLEVVVPALDLERRRACRRGRR